MCQMMLLTTEIASVIAFVSQVGGGWALLEALDEDVDLSMGEG